MTVLRVGTTSRIHTPALLEASGGYLALTVAAFLLVRPPAGGGAATLWFPPAGLAYGFLLLVGARGIPVVALALAGGGLTLGTPFSTGSERLVVIIGAAIATAVWFGVATTAQRALWRPRPTYPALAWFAVFGIALAPVGGAAINVLAAALQGAPAGTGDWARWVMGEATAVATLTPVVFLVGQEAATRVRLAPVVEPGRRLGVVVRSAVIVAMPALLVLVQGGTPGERAILPMALAPLCWLAFSGDLTRASIVLAGAALLLGATAEARFGDSMTTFQLQSVMFAGAVAALFAGAGLASEARAARKAALQSTRWRALVQAAPAMVARIDRAGRWVAEPDVQGRDDADTLVALAAQVPALASAVDVGMPATVQWRPPGDPTRRFVTHVTPLPDGGSLAVTTETTGLHTAEMTLAWERSHDRETDLPNRDLLLATAEHAAMEGGPAGLVLVGVERAGWQAALLDVDPARLMLVLAERLRNLLDPVDLAQGHALVARVGDDQFGVLVPLLSEPCRELAERMVGELREPVPTLNTPLALTAWAGVAQFEPDRTTRETLRLAATALHSAIERRRQPVVVLDELSMSTSAERARLAGEVVAAIGRGELEVVFQPDVTLPGGRLAGVEALVRWRRPEGFAAATDLFVQLAEEAGVVQAVDSWVMEQSLRQLGEWRRDHPDAELELALNVSALSLTEDLPDRLFETCLRHDVPPWYVRLEVTETALADDSSAPQVLRRIRSRGCRVALDDFGTGYATLSRLHRLPVDVVKLDRSFLAPITEDPGSQALVSLVLGLAGPLRVEVVVEGVETPQQRDVLIDLGCRRAQGFLFSRPCTGAVIDELLTADRPLGTTAAAEPPTQPLPRRERAGAVR
jgi:EAL domain-containing protein (putative c-di-GMP-specific phosphodiesterase class I)/GGDEF domain-containing protein/integral membrane sensor domain MASE1